MHVYDSLMDNACIKKYSRPSISLYKYTVLHLSMCNAATFSYLSVFVSTAASGDPWGQCPVNRKCKDKFGDGSCDKECMEPECLRDGFDCHKDRGHCK